MAADYKTPQWLLPNELNMSLNPALSESRHSLYSMDFDGTDDFIQVGQTTDAIIDFSKPWSVSWWAKWTYSPGFDCFWQFGSTASPVRYVLAWAHSTGIGYTISNSASLGISYNIANGLNDGNWHNIVFTGNGNTSGAGIMNVYVDGVLNTDTPTGTGVGSSTVAMNNIGRGHQTTGRNFNGSMDELAIWNKELNQSEINALSVASAPANLMALPTKPAAYYPLGEQAQMGYSNWNFPNGSLQSHVIDFDGTDEIVVPQFTLTAALSLSVWIKPDTLTGGQAMLFGDNDSNGYKIEFNGNTTIAVKNAGGNTSFIGSAWNTNEWQHLLITRDGSNNVTIYRNGVSWSTGTKSGNILFDRISGFNSSASHFDGQLSNIAIWNSDQSANKDNIYNNGSPQSTYTVTPNNWWKLNAADSSYNTATSTWTFTDGPGTNDGTSTTLPSTALVASDLQFESPYSNYSLSFDGINNHIDFTEVDLGLNSTVSFWINPAVTLSSEIIIGSGGASSYFLYSQATLLYVKIGSYSDTFTHSMAANNWYNITIVRTGDSVEVFQNSTSLGTKTGYGTVNNTLFDAIGARANGNLPFEGKMDELVVWNSAITASQVNQVYNNGYPADLTSLSPTAWWRLGEDAYFVSNVVTIPNKITGGTNGTGSGTQTSILVGDAPGSYANGLGSSLDVADRIGDAPESTANSVSINMIPSNRISYPAGYVPTQVDNAFSMAFDGVNDYITSNTNGISGLNNASISVWVKPTGSTSNQYKSIVNQWEATNMAWGLWLNGTGSTYTIHWNQAGASGVNSGSIIPIDEWSHIAIVKNATTLKMFHNGSEVSSFSISAATGSGATTLNIGAQYASTSALTFFNGNIDEVALFNYALSERQIKQDIYEGTTAGGKTADLNNISNLTAPVAWYRMGD